MATPPHTEHDNQTASESRFDRRRLFIFAVLIVLGIITFLLLPYLFVDRSSPGVTDTIGMGSLIPAVGSLFA